MNHNKTSRIIRNRNLISNLSNYRVLRRSKAANNYIGESIRCVLQTIGDTRKLRFHEQSLIQQIKFDITIQKSNSKHN